MIVQKDYKKVSIILLNYNTTNDVIECLKSLDEINYPNYEIIVVDNCSRKEEISKLNNYVVLMNKITLIESDKNGGFAYGNNIGINYAMKNNSDYILLLNADTLVDKDFLDSLVNSLEKDEKNIGVVTGKILYYPDTNKIWYGGGYIDWKKYIGRHCGEGEKDIGQYNEIKEVSFASGCLMLINVKANFNKFLSEEYFMYYEDVDYCANILEKGYKIIYNPNAVIYHKIGSSSGGEQSPFTVRWANRGRYIFMNKYRYKNNKLNFCFIKFKFIMTRFLKIVLLFLKGDFNKATQLYLGIKDAMSFK